jgi:L-rhamnose mutarotase
MHLTAQNQDFSARIQHLIKSQREHERTWWKAREALIEKQAARKEKRRRIEEVLSVSNILKLCVYT